MGEKRQAISNSRIDGSVCHCRFHLANGPVERQHDVNGLTEAMRTTLAAYGLNAAGKARYQGVVDTPEEALEKWDEFVASVYNGTWEPGRGAGEAGPSELVLAVEAVETKTPGAVKHTREQIEEVLDGLSPAQKRALRNDPDVASALRDIKIAAARKAAASAKGKPSLLSGLFSSRQEAAE